MGSFNFGFSSLMLFGSVYLSRAWINFSKSFVNEIYLMKSGKSIEVVTQAIWSNTKKIKICDIINPEESLNTKLKMKYFGTWILETRKGEDFYVMKDTDAFNKEVLKHVFKGIDIDVKHDSDSDIIDI